MNKVLPLIAICPLAFASNVYATELYCSTGLSDPQISTSQVWIDAAAPAPFESQPLPTGRINSTDCAGFYHENVKPFSSNNGVSNIGLNEEGFLNNETGAFPTAPGAFIESTDLQDLDNEGIANDPGWIYLGKSEGGEFQWFGDEETPVVDNPLNPTNFDISQYMDISMNWDGTQGSWSITYNNPLEFLDKLSETFGTNFFDHLAFGIKFGNVVDELNEEVTETEGRKGGNRSTPEYAFYDFDFPQINIDIKTLLNLSEDPFNLSIPYNFSGGFDMCAGFEDCTVQGLGISHVDLFARDPADPETSVPVPGPLLLMGIGLAAIGYTSRKKLN